MNNKQNVEEMNRWEITKMFSDEKIIKEQILTDQIFTDEAIINIVEEFNKDKNMLTKINIKQVIKKYHKTVNKLKNQLEKEKQFLLNESGLTLEEYENLSTMEKAVLNTLTKQNKYLRSMTSMKAFESISDGAGKF